MFKVILDKISHICLSLNDDVPDELNVIYALYYDSGSTGTMNNIKVFGSTGEVKSRPLHHIDVSSRYRYWVQGVI